MVQYKIRVASRHPSHKEILKQGQMPMFPVSVRLRFGSTIPHRPCFIDFNAIEAIKRTANKVEMKKVFDRAGINTPKYFLNNESGKNAIQDGHLGEKIFFKTPYHSRGRGVIIYETKEDALSNLNDGYFEEAQVSKREFRVHVMDGEAFYVDEKRPREQMDERPVVKNMESGYKFRRPLRDYPDEVITESIAAVLALGLDFGAADVGVNDEGVWIYEVNTAPSLRTKTRKLYQKAFVKAIWKRILGGKNWAIYHNGEPMSVGMREEDARLLFKYAHDTNDDKFTLVDEVIEKSRKYNEWLDEQPLTPHTNELNNEQDG